MITHLKRISTIIDTLSERTGRAASWLVLLMVLIIVYDVTMRYVFHIGSVALQELEWHLFACLFLLGAAYTLKHDAHVRVDIFYSRAELGDRGRAWVNIIGCVFFLIPFSILIIISSYPFVELAYSINEGSPDPGGLAYRFALKMMIPLSFALLLLQGVSQIISNVILLSTESLSNKDVKN